MARIVRNAQPSRLAASDKMRAAMSCDKPRPRFTPHVLAKVIAIAVIAAALVSPILSFFGV